LAEKLVLLAEKEDRNPKQQAARLLKEAIEKFTKDTNLCQEYAGACKE
jgi:hypothetical protein